MCWAAAAPPPKRMLQAHVVACMCGCVRLPVGPPHSQHTTSYAKYGSAHSPLHMHIRAPPTSACSHAHAHAHTLTGARANYRLALHTHPPTHTPICTHTTRMQRACLPDLCSPCLFTHRCTCPCWRHARLPCRGAGPPHTPHLERQSDPRWGLTGPSSAAAVGEWGPVVRAADRPWA